MSGSPTPDPSPADRSPAPDGTAGRTFAQRANSAMKTVAYVLIAIVIVVVAYFILEAFLPRWWAGQIGRQVNGSFSGGVGTGLLIGFSCTFLPIGLIGLAFAFGGRWRKIPAIASLILAVVAAIPNLLTLAVVLGRGNGSHAGQRIFDVQAPGFRAASLWGAILGALVGLAIVFFILRYRRRGRQLRETREQVTAAETDPIRTDPGPP